jgi:hypothetical protein
MSQVFQGTINAAWMDTQAMPQVSFKIESQSGNFENVLKIPPTSIQGTGDVSTIMRSSAGAGSEVTP